MILREGESFRPGCVNLHLDCGGLGDNICRIPAIHYLEEAYPHIQFRVFTPDWFEPLARLWITKSEIRKLGDHPDRGTWPDHWFSEQFVNSSGFHLVDVAFATFLGKTAVPIEAKNYPRFPADHWTPLRYAIPEKYVVLTPGYTSMVRTLSPQTWWEIAKGCNERGLTPVFLGSTKDRSGTSTYIPPLDYMSLGVSLCDQTTLLEAAAILRDAQAIVGIDSGLHHLAGCTDVPIIVGYNSQLPEFRMPYRHGELGWKCYPVTPDISCRGCETKLRFDPYVDFRVCYFGDLKCLDQMPASKYLEQLDLALEGK